MSKVQMKLAGHGPQAREPWIWRLCTEFDVKVNVLRAQIEPEAGWVEIELEGALESVQRATAWLHTTGLHVDPVQRSVSS
jgi:ABC-type methionine transport system ATPase subunit